MYTPSKFFKSLILMLLVIFNVQFVKSQIALSTEGKAEPKTVKYDYFSVPNDPLKARVYTLENGLKVYMTVYKDEPRIQTYIAVRAGSKNDPHETTGLAHYFEHMMFKGTPNYGSSNYAAEKVLIDQVEQLFEEYRKIPIDKVAERKAMYAKIDSISYQASKFAIPNEYDKLMSLIGADGTNAFTSLEQTVYVETIPSNQLENWAIIEADRFSKPVLRLFHTELETIYEEKNMTMTNDGRKLYTALLEGLFQKHTYGTQSTIGTQEHIKNPSMTNINKFFENYYVPNNIAICMSGDFDPDQAIMVIDKYFGGLKAKPVPAFTFEKEAPLTQPLVKEVFGPDAENLYIGFRLPGATDIQTTNKLALMDMLLSNSQAGLIDLNLNQKQKVLSAGSSPMIMADYSALMLTGKPKDGQTLEQVKDLLLEQIQLIKKGEFPDWLITAIINDLELQQIKQYETNDARAMSFVNSFILGVPYEVDVNALQEMRKITKAEIVAFANQYFADNYVVVYKRTGKDKDYVKISKTKLTPIELNRDKQSDFYKKIEANNVHDIQPVFIDFEKDIKKLTIKDSKIQVLYKENEENKTFSLYYITEMGSNHDKVLGTAINYLKYLGTKTYTSEQLKQEFYKLGTSFNVFNSEDQVYVSLTGLSENMTKALELFESLLQDPQADKAALDNLINDILKKREDAKKNSSAIFGALVSYGIYGPKKAAESKLSEAELKALTPEKLIEIIKGLNSYEHKVLYYGSQSSTEVCDILNKMHKIPATLKPIPAETKFPELPTTKNQVYVVNFDTKQAQILMLNQSELYDKGKVPIITLFNQYFGGSMNSIVFQELREARALAYTAMAFYQSPDKKDKHYYTLGYIATQYDKIKDAITGINGLMDTMPFSEKSFNLAKESVVNTLKTSRITKSDVLFTYLAYQDLGINYDINKDVYENVGKMTFADIKTFEETYMKNKPKTILVLGSEKDLDFKMLKKFGKVKMLELNQIFGY